MNDTPDTAPASRSGPPSKDGLTIPTQAARERMTQVLTEISATAPSDLRATLDRYLCLFNRTGDEASLPVMPTPFNPEHPSRSISPTRNGCLLHTVSSMVMAYWAMVAHGKYSDQVVWSDRLRHLGLVAKRGLGQMAVVGSHELGFWLVTEEQAERLEAARNTPKRGRNEAE